MLNLDYEFKYIDGIRRYAIPCSGCGLVRWKPIGKRNQSCYSCSASVKGKKRYAKGKRYRCIHPDCTRLIITPLYFCKSHKRLVFNRYKEEARWAVSNAVKRGQLQKLPCLECGEGKAEAHHPDHRNKLEVLWLCRSHHLQVHGGRFN